MPLLLLVGHPCSGKSMFTRALLAALSARIDQEHVHPDQHANSEHEHAFSESSHQVLHAPQIVIVNHQTLHRSRAEAYANSHNERRFRAAMKSTIERKLNANDIVIVDWCNAIKGWRYELFCRVREAKTTHALVYIDTPAEMCRKWNTERKNRTKTETNSTNDVDDQEPYDEQMLEELMQRMEPPNATKRWDQPLFVVNPMSEMLMQAIKTHHEQHGDAETHSKEPIIEYAMDNTYLNEQISAILNALLYGKQQVPSLATIKPAPSVVNYTSILSDTTQDIINALVAQQTEVTYMVGDTVSLPHTSMRLSLSQRVSVPTLRRVQRQFLRMMQLRGTHSVGTIGSLFVEFLNTQLR